jgi:hypothetical protein
MTLRLHFALLAALMLTAAVPAGADELYFSPSDTLICSFDIFPVHVRVDAMDSIMGYNISVVISGDPCVQIAGVSEGSLPGSNGDTTFFRWLTPWSADSISVNGSVLGKTVDGPGILFTILMKGTQPGTAWLDIVYSDLRNGVNQSLPHDNSNRARIVVDEAVAVRQSSWGAVKSVFREN